MSLLAYPTLLNRLRDVDYREAFLATSIRNAIALQIRALRKSKFDTQQALGEVVGKPANVISRLENPNYGKVTIQTLTELANAFDVALIVRFATFGELAEQIENTSDLALDVPSFDEELREVSSYQSDLQQQSYAPSAIDLIAMSQAKLGGVPPARTEGSTSFPLGALQDRTNTANSMRMR